MAVSSPLARPTAPARRPAAAPARRPASHASAAPVRRPRPSAPAQPVRRLRVVDNARLAAAARRRRMRAVMVLAGIFVAGCLFALAAFNALLVSGQGRIDELNRRVADAQVEYSANRLKVAELAAPERVVQVAQRRLGMVPPPDVTYLTPSQAMADEVGPKVTQRRASHADGDTSWASTKPYLAP